MKGLTCIVPDDRDLIKLQRNQDKEEKERGVREALTAGILPPAFEGIEEKEEEVNSTVKKCRRRRTPERALVLSHKEHKVGQQIENNVEEFTMS